MRSDVKTKIAVVSGICLIALVASMITLPFRGTDSAVQKVSHDSIQNLEDSEKRMFNFMTHEKSEIKSKMGGKTNFP